MGEGSDSSNSIYLGKYNSLAALQSGHPTAVNGNYATVDAVAGSNTRNYIWDQQTN